jgi:hypothetical protein
LLLLLLLLLLLHDEGAKSMTKTSTFCIWSQATALHGNQPTTLL